MRRYTKIIMENGALPETKKLLISGYLGEISHASAQKEPSTHPSLGA